MAQLIHPENPKRGFSFCGLSRFLLILLTSLSVINTLWCIVMSPYLLGNSFTEEIEEVNLTS